MSDSSTSALSLLFEDVKAQFTADATNANLVFGWQERTKRINQGLGGAARVVFEPGEDKGKAGQYGPSVQNRRPMALRATRSLGTFLESCTVECWAFDASAPGNEQVQYEAARWLHDLTIRAIYRSPRVGHGSFEIKDPTWITDKKELRFGAAIRFTLIVQAKIADDPGPVRDLDGVEVLAEHAIGPAEIALPGGDETDGTDETP